MDINNIRLGNINSGEGSNQSKKLEQEIITKQFNPGSQSLPSQGAINQMAARARMLNKKSKFDDSEELLTEENEQEIEIATLGLIKLSEDQIEAFSQRVGRGILRQEHEILDTVNTFAGNDKMLRNVIGGLLLS